MNKITTTRIISVEIPLKEYNILKADCKKRGVRGIGKLILATIEGYIEWLREEEEKDANKK